MFSKQEAGAFENNTGKEPQKPHLKSKNICKIQILYICMIYNIFTENISSARKPMQVVVFCKHVLYSFKDTILNLSIMFVSECKVI